jgi:hypothetical protein
LDKYAVPSDWMAEELDDVTYKLTPLDSGRVKVGGERDKWTLIHTFSLLAIILPCCPTLMAIAIV